MIFLKVIIEFTYLTLKKIQTNYNSLNKMYNKSKKKKESIETLIFLIEK